MDSSRDMFYSRHYIDMVDYIYGCCIYMGWCTSVVYWTVALAMILRPIERRKKNDEVDEPLKPIKEDPVEEQFVDGYI